MRPLLRIDPLVEIARLTGADSINHTDRVGIGGTDLGHCVEHDGKLYLLFGDTYATETDLPDPDRKDRDWRFSAMAWTTDRDLSDGLNFNDWLARPDGTARQLFRSDRGKPITEIPTGAISVNGSIYAWYMSVSHWGVTGDWTVDYTGLTRWRTGEEAFTVLDRFTLPGDKGIGMVAAARADEQGRPILNGAPHLITGPTTRPARPMFVDEGYVYLWATPGGRWGGVKLLRVLAATIEDAKSYEYFAGLDDQHRPRWSRDADDAEEIIHRPVGEMSVLWNPAIRGWMMISHNEPGRTFDLRQSPTPWGPWSSSMIACSFADKPGGWYAPYTNEWLLADGGKTIYLTYSKWRPYDVYLGKVTLKVEE